MLRQLGRTAVWSTSSCRTPQPRPSAAAGFRHDGQHTGVRPVAAGQGRAGVEQTGPGHDAERRRPPGHQRRALRHVGGALLVAGDDRADVPRVDQPIEEVVVLDAGQAEQRVDAEPAEGIDDQVGDSARRAVGHGRRCGRGATVRADVASRPSPRPRTRGARRSGAQRRWPTRSRRTGGRLRPPGSDRRGLQQERAGALVALPHVELVEEGLPPTGLQRPAPRDDGVPAQPAAVVRQHPDLAEPVVGEERAQRRAHPGGRELVPVHVAELGHQREECVELGGIGTADQRHPATVPTRSQRRRRPTTPTRRRPAAGDRRGPRRGRRVGQVAGQRSPAGAASPGTVRP